MSDTAQYYFEGLEIVVHLKSYLVEVRHTGNRSVPDNKLSDLPDWVFHSKSAIWFLEENAPYQRRALDGERIKRELSSRICKPKVTQIH